MKNDCAVVNDLLPLYAEGMVSAETAEYVRGHIAMCDKCRERLEEMSKEPEAVSPSAPPPPLEALRRKLRLMRVRSALLAAAFLLTALLAVFALVTAPEYLPYSEGLLTVTEGEGRLSLTFAPEAAGHRIDVTGDEVFVEAWSSPLGRLRREAEFKTVTIAAPAGPDTPVYYSPNDGGDDILIHGQLPAGVAGVQSLPRLILGYYLAAAALALAALAVLRMVLRKNERALKWLDRLLPAPLAYCAAHFVIMGPATVSYCTGRDFVLILAAGTLICWALFLARSVFRLRRELKRP